MSTLAMSAALRMANMMSVPHILCFVSSLLFYLPFDFMPCVETFFVLLLCYCAVHFSINRLVVHNFYDVV